MHWLRQNIWKSKTSKSHILLKVWNINKFVKGILLLIHWNFPWNLNSIFWPSQKFSKHFADACQMHSVCSIFLGEYHMFSACPFCPHFPMFAFSLQLLADHHILSVILVADRSTTTRWPLGVCSQTNTHRQVVNHLVTSRRPFADHTNYSYPYIHPNTHDHTDLIHTLTLNLTSCPCINTWWALPQVHEDPGLMLWWQQPFPCWPRHPGLNFNALMGSATNAQVSGFNDIMSVAVLVVPLP